jgi:hypothetical protein
MLPNVSALRLDDKKCVPCMTPVRFQDQDAQFDEHMANSPLSEFEPYETHEDQIEARDCSICLEPLDRDSPNASRPAVGEEGMDFYVDYCGSDHYFHKWCAHTLITRNETKRCPDCRLPASNDALAVLAQSYPPVPVPVPLELPLLPQGTPRLGAQEPLDRLLRWVFWIKPGASPNASATRLNNQEDNAKVRSTFGQYINQEWPSNRAGVAVWDQRLVVSVSENRVLTAAREGRDEFFHATCVTCTVHLPNTRLAVETFRTQFDDDMDRHGLGSMMRRWLGIIGAAPRTPRERVVLEMYGTWRELQLDPAARPPDPLTFQVGDDGDQWWKVYMLEDDPLPITIGRTGPQSATDVPVEWRFWIKGPISENFMAFGAHSRQHLSRWFRSAESSLSDATEDSFAPLEIPIRLEVAPLVYPNTIYVPRAVDRGAPQTPMTQCDYQLYLPTTELAQEFVNACGRISRATGRSRPGRTRDAELGFAELMQQLVGVTGARSTEDEDFPTIRTGVLRRSKRTGSCPYDEPLKPEMMIMEYNAWHTHTLVPLAPMEQRE